MEYPNLPERKLIDVPAISRVSRGTCKHFTKISIHISGRHLRPTCPRHDGRSTNNHDKLHDMMVGAQTTTTNSTTRWSSTNNLTCKFFTHKGVFLPSTHKHLCTCTTKKKKSNIFSASIKHLIRESIITYVNNNRIIMHPSSKASKASIITGLLCIHHQ